MDIEPLQDVSDGTLQGLHFRRVARPDMMSQWNAIGCLHHPEHDLPIDSRLFGHAVGSQVIELLRHAMGTDHFEQLADVVARPKQHDVYRITVYTLKIDNDHAAIRFQVSDDGNDGLASQN